MVKEHRLGFGILALALLISAGCKEERDPGAIEVMDPVALDKYIVYIDKLNDKAYLLDVVSKELKARTTQVKLGPSPVFVERRKSSSVEELLVLCQGKEEQIDEPSQAAQLLVLEGKGVARTYSLESPFNALSQSEDGAIAVLYFSAATTDQSQTDLTRRNQVAIVDLTQEPSASNPAFRQLDSEDGSAPQAVVISPVVPVVGQERRLAVALFQKQVSLLDLTHLELGRKEIKIPFERPIAVSPVLFGKNPGSSESDAAGATTTMYLRSVGSDDIYIIDLLSTTGRSNDFWPTVKMRKAGSVSSDMALYQEASSEGDGSASTARLLVVSSVGQKVSIIDPATGNVSYVTLGFPADRALVYQAKAPFDDAVAPRALLYNSEGASQMIAFLDLQGVQERGMQNLESKSLSKPFGSLLSLNNPEPLVALVEQGSGVSLLNLADRTIDPIQTGTLMTVVLDAAARTIWLPYANSDPERNQLGFIEVETRDTGYVLLDAKINKVVPVASGGQERVVVTHPSQVGYVTIFDAVNPKRDTAVTLQGFLVAGILD